MMKPHAFLGRETFRMTGPLRCPSCSRFMTRRMRAEGHVETCKGGRSRTHRAAVTS
jgi:hypothetical protein